MAVRTAKVTFKVIQGHWQWCHSMAFATYNFLLFLHCIYVYSLHHLWDIYFFPNI